MHYLSYMQCVSFLFQFKLFTIPFIFRIYFNVYLFNFIQTKIFDMLLEIFLKFQSYTITNVMYFQFNPNFVTLRIVKVKLN